MTVRTLKKKPVHKTNAGAPLPDSADRAVIAGTEFILIPAADFEEWYEDQMLAATAAERLKTERNMAVPFEEAMTRMGGKRMRK